MPGRRKRARCIGFDPGFICFKPCGRPGRGMETLELEADELEALRLSDFEGLYQEECARRMGISRTTLSRTLAQAHRKVADALLHGKRLVIAVAEEVTSARAADGEVVPLERPHDSEQPSPADRGSTERQANAQHQKLIKSPVRPEEYPSARRKIKHIEGSKMRKIVLTANDDRGLEGEMAMHFGHCPYFVVAHVNGEDRVELTEVQENPYAEDHQPGQIPQYIKTLGADVVIAGGMGGRAIDWFQQLGIEVATGTRQGVGATLEAYLTGAVAGAAECNHDH